MEELKYLTTAEVCKILRIGYTTLCKYNKTGKLKPHRVGHRNLYKRSELISCVEA